MGAKYGRAGAMLTPSELVLTFGGCYLCATFGKNGSRNATVRVHADRHMHAQGQTEFIIYPMLYAVVWYYSIICNNETLNWLYLHCGRT